MGIIAQEGLTFLQIHSEMSGGGRSPAVDFCYMIGTKMQKCSFVHLHKVLHSTFAKITQNKISVGWGVDSQALLWSRCLLCYRL